MFDADGKFRGDPTQLDRIEELAAWHQMDCETHLEDKDALASTIGTVVGTVVAAVATVALTVVTGGAAAAALVPMFTAWGMGTAAATTASAMAVAAGTAMLSTAAEKITVAMIKASWNRYDLVEDGLQDLAAVVVSGITAAATAGLIKPGPGGPDDFIEVDGLIEDSSKLPLAHPSIVSAWVKKERNCSQIWQ